MLTKIKAIALTGTLITMAAIAPKAEAADRYALVCIENEINRTIHYSFRWGNQDWRTRSLDPEDGWMHFWEYDYPDQDSSPDLEVRYDSDLSNDEFWIRETLRREAVPDQDCPNNGNVYVFVYDGGTRSHIELLRRR